ncbi:hypothetical protein NQ314_007696 [Rhamnusium bicolor]|uniref:Tetraspanin n=1 Tax=Rhamnusium bicolor TaxID=1586634 RepID=A0AAV8YJP1_9CUCU|nr:hypothetical protein NQ314_007696 [Rhamnusium bicolor]
MPDTVLLLDTNLSTAIVKTILNMKTYEVLKCNEKLFAIAGIGAAIWMFVDPTIPLHFTQESHDYLITTVIILLASIILLIVALLGIYSVSKEVRKALVAMQCCGAESPRDWTRGKELNMGVSSSPTMFDIPESCCRPEIDPKECVAATHLKVGSDPNTKIIYERGCYIYIMDKLDDNVQTILIIGGIILAVQVLGLVLGLILACSMNRSHRYKA